MVHNDPPEDEVTTPSNDAKSVDCSMQDFLELNPELFALPKNAQELIDVL